MSAIAVKYIANAGILLHLGETRILIDALHRGNRDGFPDVDAPLWAQMCADAEIRSPDVVFFTHCHPDHFSQALAERAQQVWPEALFILPEPKLPRQHLLAGGRHREIIKGAVLEFAALPHEGEVYRSVSHYGLLASWSGHRIVVPGDCAVADPTLAAWVGEQGVDVAVLNFPWLSLRAGRQCIQEALRPAHTLIYHFPTPEADKLGYLENAKRAKDRHFPDADIRLLTVPLQQELL